jgi:hypothetical protein
LGVDGEDGELEGSRSCTVTIVYGGAIAVWCTVKGIAIVGWAVVDECTEEDAGIGDANGGRAVVVVSDG